MIVLKCTVAVAEAISTLIFAFFFIACSTNQMEPLAFEVPLNKYISNQGLIKILIQ